MLFYAAALQTLNYDWDTLLNRPDCAMRRIFISPCLNCLFQAFRTLVAGCLRDLLVLARGVPLWEAETFLVEHQFPVAHGEHGAQAQRSDGGPIMCFRRQVMRNAG